MIMPIIQIKPTNNSFPFFQGKVDLISPKEIKDGRVKDYKG
jgi:hypothetical protein